MSYSFKENEEIKIGNKLYKIKRNFIGKRTVQEAIYTVVKNEAYRNQIVRSKNNSKYWLICETMV